MNRRVVITGIGVIAPHAHGKAAFAEALKQGQSALRHLPRLAELGFRCQVGGIPTASLNRAPEYFSEEARFAMNSYMIYGAMAALDCWRDGGLEVPSWDSAEVDWDTGCILGTGGGGSETLEEKGFEEKIRQGKVRRLGGTLIEQTMVSAATAKVTGLLALGGPLSTNSTACATGTEAIVEGFHWIRSGRCQRVLAGGAEGGTERSAPFLWGGFEAMRVLAGNHNAEPESASRPFSASADGFVPSAGAAVLMLEDANSALARGAPIYAEILAGTTNGGGQRGGGTMTAANPEGVRRCIRQTVQAAGLRPEDIDLINGHFTATQFDASEARNWAQALELDPLEFPTLQATKSLLGHGLGAAGAWETAAVALQLHGDFIHPSRNCDDLLPELQSFRDAIFTPTRTPRVALKASFGFGDVNACLALRRWEKP